jgi:hypothetical protein
VGSFDWLLFLPGLAATAARDFAHAGDCRVRYISLVETGAGQDDIERNAVHDKIGEGGASVPVAQATFHKPDLATIEGGDFAAHFAGIDAVAARSARPLLDAHDGFPFAWARRPAQDGALVEADAASVVVALLHTREDAPGALGIQITHFDFARLCGDAQHRLDGVIALWYLRLWLWVVFGYVCAVRQRCIWLIGSRYLESAPALYQEPPLAAVCGALGGEILLRRFSTTTSDIPRHTFVPPFLYKKNTPVLL